jgi:hypothetical protein
MKKQLLTLAMLVAVTFAMAQGNCDKIKQLINKANKQLMSAEMSDRKFKTADDFEVSYANTTLDGAGRCYVQDVNFSKMYIAEFGTADGRSLDATLSRKADELTTLLKSCLGAGFVIKDNKSNEYVLKSIQFEGAGDNRFTRVSLMVIYNPADKKQLLFLSIRDQFKLITSIDLLKGICTFDHSIDII